MGGQWGRALGSCPGRTVRPPIPAPLWVRPGREARSGAGPRPCTYCALDAPSGLPEELRLGVSHLRCVEQLLPLDPLEFQYTLEGPGGCGGGGSEALLGPAGLLGGPRARTPAASHMGCGQVSQMVVRLVGSRGRGWRQLPGGLLGAVLQAGLQQERHVSCRVLGTHVCVGAETTRVHA